MYPFTPKTNRHTRLFARCLTLLIPAVLLMTLLAQTVFARATYVIRDEDRVIVLTTTPASPAKVLSKAGIQLDHADTYIRQELDGVFEITVRRARNITLQYCGQNRTVISYGETVHALLTRLDIPTEGPYTYSVPMDCEVLDGMHITVDRVTQKQETQIDTIPYETTYCYTPNMAKGETKVAVPGVPGQKQSICHVVYTNDTESQRTVLQETVLTQPTNEILVVGTGTGSPSAKTPAIGDGVIVTADGQVLKFDKALEFKATAYTHTDAGCNMITATGTTVRIGTVAVDPRVIPYGTKMFIISNDGKYVYGLSAAEDCGGAIKNNRIDLYFPTTAECFKFGVRNCTVYFLTES